MNNENQEIEATDYTKLEKNVSKISGQIPQINFPEHTKEPSIFQKIIFKIKSLLGI